MGRYSKRTAVLSVRLTHAESDELERLARKWNLRVSDMIRHLVKEAVIREKVGRG